MIIAWILVTVSFLVALLVVVILAKSGVIGSTDVQWIGVVLLFLAMLSAANVGFARFGSTRSEKWLATIAPTDSSPPRDSAKAALQRMPERILRAMNGDSTSVMRYRLQYRSVESAIALHRDVMGQFYRAHFVHVSIATAFAVLTTALLLLVSIKGWTSSDRRLTTAVITSASIAALYTTLAAVYQQSKNVSDSKALFQRALALRETMLSYAVSGRSVSGDTISLQRMVVSLDKELAQVTVIPIGFDDSKIPSAQLDKIGEGLSKQ